VILHRHGYTLLMIISTCSCTRIPHLYLGVVLVLMTLTGSGGAAYVSSMVLLRSCEITGNHANVNGGAVYTDFGAVANIRNCSITGNSAAQSGVSTGLHSFILNFSYTAKLAQSLPIYTRSADVMFLCKLHYLVYTTMYAIYTNRLLSLVTAQTKHLHYYHHTLQTTKLPAATQLAMVPACKLMVVQQHVQILILAILEMTVAMVSSSAMVQTKGQHS
jgi:hypothetical protein